MNLPVIYVAGPFRARNAWLVEQNVRRAEETALSLWQLGGCAVICPHTNTRFFDGAADDTIWLQGDLELLRRSDAVFALPTWAESQGATAEVRAAQAQGLPVLYSIEQAARWLAQGARR